jgi:hypothetical protein
MDDSPTRFGEKQRGHRSQLHGLNRGDVVLDVRQDVLRAAMARQIATVRRLRAELAREAMTLKGLMRVADESIGGHD